MAWKALEESPASKVGGVEFLFDQLNGIGHEQKLSGAGSCQPEWSWPLKPIAASM